MGRIKNKSFCSFGATGRAYDILYEVKALAKELEKKNFEARIITNSKYQEHEMTKFKSFEFRYLDIKSEATTTIFGDKIGIHMLTQKPIIILIKNKEIAESYQNHFELLWRIAKE
ncbi:hypothetical protein COV11_01010 [Candidatus Woesearchaeota archaeon CG10_big_fil_rev_8_21_14_0_10_30_7]|nr:MAG: hypothetical protein COV11_01010 [Candidatus Woesearchaeota archaeon CG10_big_fil_rev_8_21_14_0_10_30_7]